MRTNEVVVSNNSGTTANADAYDKFSFSQLSLQLIADAIMLWGFHTAQDINDGASSLRLHYVLVSTVDNHGTVLPHL